MPPKSGTIATEDPNSAGFQTGPGEATEEHLFDGLSATSGSVGSGSIIDVCALACTLVYDCNLCLNARFLKGAARAAVAEEECIVQLAASIKVAKVCYHTRAIAKPACKHDAAHFSLSIIIFVH